MVPTPVDYWITTTYARERIYRTWWVSQHKDMPLIEAYQELARKFPFGLADVEPLAEEQSNEVMRGAQK